MPPTSHNRTVYAPLPTGVSVPAGAQFAAGPKPAGDMPDT
jgi:hypothetical protein